MNDPLKQFVEKVFSINGSVSTTYGAALSVGNRQNVMSDGSLIVNQLRPATVELAKLIASKKSDPKAIKEKSQMVEGYILNLQVMGQISSDFCNSLLEDLHNITDK